MCGIFLSIGLEGGSSDHDHIRNLLDRRGPDCSRAVVDTVELSHGNVTLNWYCTVLSLRGNQTQSQPIQDPSSGSKLCWNGEAWSIGDTIINGNDTQAVFDLLMRRNICSTEEARNDIIKSLMLIRGPFAFVFYDDLNCCIYFGRDALGRRSLLYRQDELTLTFSSVGDGRPDWLEVPADAVYVLDLKKFTIIPHSEKSIDDKNINFLTSNIAFSSFPYREYGKYPAFNHALPSSSNSALHENSPAVIHLEHLLDQAIDVRTRSIPYHSSHEKGQPRTAILFSGGLDCAVLARMLHDRLPRGENIDLLNVAFYNPRSHGPTVENAHASYELCPDRMTARASYRELKKICPDREWRLVCVNISYEEMLDHRSQVLQLMSPHDTEMDLSIALALYFASRGVGTCAETGIPMSQYSTPARVLVSGLGADELFGGYQRHATAFMRQGYAGLLEELELDITRLGQRNLGRDDRVISHWGKEARYPFLDEDLVKWAVTAPLWEKCGFGQSTISSDDGDRLLSELEPGKKVLRLLAQKLGMKNVAQEKKRAIQFGARTAKLGTVRGKIKGTQKVL